MDNKDNTNENVGQVQDNVNNAVVNNTNVEQAPQVQPVVESNNTTVQNAATTTNTTTNNNVVSNDVQQQAPLTPNVAPLQPNSDADNAQVTTNIPKSQAEAVSNNDEVRASANLISASEAGVGTSTSMKTKEELTKKDKLLDGLPGIGVPIKEENSTNNVESTPSQSEEITPEKVSFKKKVQYFFTVVFFILVAVFIYFLPEVTNLINQEQSKQEVIKDGFLTCELETNRKDITTNNKNRFGFTDEKLETYKKERKVSASSSNDSSLSEADEECEALYEQTKSLSGIDVKCSLRDNEQTSIQSIDYGTININKVTSAFSEAGGVYPDYELGEDINKIESDMKASGFKCERSKT